jgi:co-chaperonin GroES (HSP10)
MMMSKTPTAEKVSEFTPRPYSGPPLIAAMWQIVVQPREAKTTYGDSAIALPPEVVRNQEITTNVGRVIECGPTALEGKTASGIELKRVTKDISTPEELQGKYVLYQKFTGQTVQVLGPSNTPVTLIILTATEILAIVPDPSRIVNVILGANRDR